MKTSSANPRWVSLILFVLVLSFYLYTLLPSLAWVDGMKHQQEVISGQSLTLAEFPDSLFASDPFPFARLGVAAWDHPLYVIVGHTIIQLLPGVDSLWLVNLFSAVSGAATIAVFFRLCHVHTQSLAASLVASLFLAVSHTYWFHAVTPETYQPFSFLLLSSVYLFDKHERTGQKSALIASLFVLGLAGSIHLLTFFAFPSAALYFLISGRLRRPGDIHPRRLVAPGLAFLAGFSVYLIQLFRMLRTFPIAMVMGPVAGSFFVRDALVTTTL
ncbi:MAG: DUF2723 domain-containing protein, partial [Chloroflexi bacterium]|nr:DUF2723 domain-containing protein [Chloroflexota bacterium]